MAALADRPVGVAAALVAPPIAAYTAVLLSDTATPSWNAARHELPFVFVGSAAAASGGLGMLFAPKDEAGPARRLAMAGAAVELAAERRMEASMGVTAEPLHAGTAGRLMRASKTLTGFGGAAAMLGGRSRILSMAAGAALAGRIGVHPVRDLPRRAASARDPKYTVVPQRERVEARRASERRAAEKG